MPAEEDESWDDSFSDQAETAQGEILPEPIHRANPQEENRPESSPTSEHQYLSTPASNEPTGNREEATPTTTASPTITPASTQSILSEESGAEAQSATSQYQGLVGRNQVPVPSLSRNNEPATQNGDAGPLDQMAFNATLERISSQQINDFALPIPAMGSPSWRETLRWLEQEPPEDSLQPMNEDTPMRGEDASQQSMGARIASPAPSGGSDSVFRDQSEEQPRPSNEERQVLDEASQQIIDPMDTGRLSSYWPDVFLGEELEERSRPSSEERQRIEEASQQIMDSMNAGTLSTNREQTLLGEQSGEQSRSGNEEPETEEASQQILGSTLASSVSPTLSES